MSGDEAEVRARIARLLEERDAYRRLAHELGIRSGWLSPANGSSWKVLDAALRDLMEGRR